MDDSRFQFKYDKQKWRPANYSNKYYGKVPLFFALKESLNSVTARVAVDVGLEKVRGSIRNPEVEKDGADGGRVGEEGDDPHLSLTGRAEEGKDLVDASEEASPGDATGGIGPVRRNGVDLSPDGLGDGLGDG
jgi:membrane peptidoglycan carboxypeptidase